MQHTSTPINRTEFFKRTVAGAAGLILPSLVTGQTQDKPAPIQLETVKEFVGVCHSKLDRVKKMLEDNHLLLHVSYDWGGGDFESGIEAAGHVGNKDIADYLLSKGARYNIYLACMLGHLDTVKKVLNFNSNLLNSKGPHGFTMLHHARKGAAQPVIDYLESLGAKETRLDFYSRT